MEGLFTRYLMDDIVYEEEAFFRHVILSWLEFEFKVFMNYMARTHYQIRDESLLAGIFSGIPYEDISFCLEEEASDESTAKKLLKETLPFISSDVDFCKEAYTMVVLLQESHFFRVAQAVYEFMNKAEKPWQCRLCLHLFVVALQSAGMIYKTTVPPADLREGPNVAATLWLNKTCGESRLNLRERWLDTRFLVDLPRDLNIFPRTRDEGIIETQNPSAFTYIPLTRSLQVRSESVSSEEDIRLQVE